VLKYISHYKLKLSIFKNKKKDKKIVWNIIITIFYIWESFC